MGVVKKLLYRIILDPIIIRIRGRLLLIEDNINKEKKKLLLNSLQSIGWGVKLNGDSHFFSDPKKIILGNNVHIGNNSFLKSEGGIVIGHNTHISRNVTIYTTNHDYKSDALPYNNNNIYKPVIIGENVWIGMNVSIIPGIKIGEGAIIGMGTVVNRNIEPLEIVGNTKALNLKNRNEQLYNELKDSLKFGGVNGNPIIKVREYFLSTYFENREKSIVFVLSTGRSGSKAIVDTMNQHPNCKAFHEDIKQLIRISADIAYNEKINDNFEELKEILYNKIWSAKEGQVILHSDQRLWNLVTFLSGYFPNSKFIHLIRDPKSAVKSMSSRKWYESNEYPNINYHDWAKYRLQGDLLGEVQSQEWNSWSGIERCAWYWSFVNSSINEQLMKLPQERVLKVELEDLAYKMTNLFDFIGVENFSNIKVKESNIVNNLHKNRYDSLNHNSKVDMIIDNIVNKYYSQP